MLVLLIFNGFYCAVNPSYTTSIILGGIIGMIIVAVTVVILGGFQLFGTGLTDFSVRALFGIGTILNLLFQIQVGGLTIGIGLAQTVYGVFATSDLVGLGLAISLILSMVALASGMMIVLG